MGREQRVTAALQRATREELKDAQLQVVTEVARIVLRRGFFGRLKWLVLGR